MSASKSKRQPLRAQPPVDPPPPVGDNNVDNVFDGFDTNRTFQFGGRTPVHQRLSLDELITSPYLFNTMDNSLASSRQPSTFNPSTSSMSNISLDEIMVSRRMAEPVSTATAGTMAWYVNHQISLVTTCIQT